MGNIIDCFTECFFMYQKDKKSRCTKNKLKETNEIELYTQKYYPDDTEYVHLNENDFDKIL